MVDNTPGQVSVQAVERPLNLVPVGLKEAALDSPTFRATAVHFADQVEIIEKWLDGYVRAASKLVSEVASLESLVNSFLAQSAPPSTVSEAVLDHDYTLLALTRYGEGAREVCGNCSGVWSMRFGCCEAKECGPLLPGGIGGEETLMCR